MSVCIKYKNAERIDLSEGIDLDKTSKSKECEIRINNYFNNDFRFDSKVCNHCKRGITISEWTNLAIVNVRGIGYRVIMFDMTESHLHKILGDFESSDL